MYKERIQTLLKEAVRREPEYAPEDPDSTAMFIKERVDKMFAYTDYVIRMENHMTVLSVMGCSGEEYRDKVQDMDFGRKARHDAAIASVNQLNRLSQNWAWNCSMTGRQMMSTVIRLGTCAGKSATSISRGGCPMLWISKR